MLQHFTVGVFCIKCVYFNIIIIYTVTVGQMQALLHVKMYCQFNTFVKPDSQFSVKESKYLNMIYTINATETPVQYAYSEMLMTDNIIHTSDWLPPSMLSTLLLSIAQLP